MTQERNSGARAGVDRLPADEPDVTRHGRTLQATAPVPPLTVVVPSTDGKRREISFQQAFRMGRGGECEVYVEGRDVSRVHAEILIQNGGWWVRDLASTNGTFLDGQRVTLAPLPGRAVVQLGRDGRTLLLRSGTAQPDGDDVTVTGSPRLEGYWLRHYLEGSQGSIAGQRTIMIRQAFRDVMKKRRRKHFLAIAVAAILLGVAVAISLYQRAQLAKQAGIAETIFYQMKAVEVQLAQLEGRTGSGAEPGADVDRSAARTRLAGLERSYDAFLTELGVYNPRLTREQRLVLRIARVFGECELAMPDGLVEEVDRYVTWWRSNTRLADAIARAQANGYVSKVVAAMTRHQLPPQLFYLALEESAFRSEMCGPQTRFGIPKGAWQFVPETAMAYGLRTGPLYILPLPDPPDDRHDFPKATEAAARYLHDIYANEAEASGLLAVASYNWGEGNVRALIGSLPENPRDRNMWRLIRDHRKQIPRETYAYVFRVFSAAVIGEDPHLFGFDFDNPLPVV